MFRCGMDPCPCVALRATSGTDECWQIRQTRQVDVEERLKFRVYGMQKHHSPLKQDLKIYQFPALLTLLNLNDNITDRSSLSMKYAAYLPMNETGCYCCSKIAVCRLCNIT